MESLTDTKTEKVASLITRFHLNPIQKVLVVGCGSGIEAAILAQRLKADVTGIDIEANFDETAARYCLLRQGDAAALDLDDGLFDFVFSYHALEHIEQPEKALLEMRRVMKDGAGFWIGTPNRLRAVGYIGGKNTSLSEKLKWNLLDWRMRIAGRFENRFGAHAGFSQPELTAMLKVVFGMVDDRTFDYFSAVYPRKAAAIKRLEQAGVSRWVYPSIYFSGSK